MKGRKFQGKPHGTPQHSKGHIPNRGPRRERGLTTNLIKGIISTTGKGLGFVNDDNAPLEEDVLIEAGYLNTALNGDKVEVTLHPKIKGERQTGEVTRIISRGK